MTEASTTVPATTTTAPVSPVKPPAPLASAAAVIASLVPAEQAIHDPATPLASLPALGATEQLAFGTLSDHADWMPIVLGALPASQRAAVQATAAANRELQAIPGPPAPAAIPKWRVVAPQPPEQLLMDYHDAATASGVPWQVLAAIHLVESRMGRIHGPSGAGAQGPMQFLPSTWASYGAGGDIWSDRDAILAAGRFLHANGAPSDVAAAVFHYNPSSHYVRSVLDYAAAMSADARAYYAFYGWQVYVATASGEFLLPVGFAATDGQSG